MTELEPAPITDFEQLIANPQTRHNPSTGETHTDHRVARIKLWLAHDIRCAIYWGGMSFNGYCQLPMSHPDRIIAEAYNDFEHNDPDRRDRRSWTLRPESNVGYDILQDIEIHGGLTYGPDDEGWLGFDTGHAGDDWSDEEIRRWLEPANREAFLSFREIQLLIGPDMYPPGRAVRSRPRAPYDIDWTMDRLEQETDHLAAQIDQRRGMFITNGAH